MLPLRPSPKTETALGELAKGEPLGPGRDSERDRHWIVLLEEIDRALSVPEGKEYGLANPGLQAELRHHFHVLDRKGIPRTRLQSSTFSELSSDTPDLVAQSG